MTQTIVSINSIGFRCPSTDFLTYHQLRKMSSPFDNMFCDIETSLKIIHNKFGDFLNDLVFYPPHDFSHARVIYAKNTTEINPIFKELAKGNKLTYMKHNYYLSPVFFNQNYTLNDDIISRDVFYRDTSNYVKDSDNIKNSSFEQLTSNIVDEMFKQETGTEQCLENKISEEVDNCMKVKEKRLLELEQEKMDLVQKHLETEEEIMMAKIEKNTSNMYNWKHICCFNHHNFLKNNQEDTDVYNTMRRRCERFNYTMSTYPEKSALFYMTRIIKYENYIDYVKNIIELKIKYEIPCFMIIIVNCDTVEYSEIREYYDELNKCLFILKKVNNYDTQLANYEVDNIIHPGIDTDYVKELNIIKKYFDFDLVEKRDIDNALNENTKNND